MSLHVQMQGTGQNSCASMLAYAGTTPAAFSDKHVRRSMAATEATVEALLSVSRWLLVSRMRHLANL